MAFRFAIGLLAIGGNVATMAHEQEIEKTIEHGNEDEALE